MLNPDVARDGHLVELPAHFLAQRGDADRLLRRHIDRRFDPRQPLQIVDQPGKPGCAVFDDGCHLLHAVVVRDHIGRAQQRRRKGEGANRRPHLVTGQPIELLESQIAFFDRRGVFGKKRVHRRSREGARRARQPALKFEALVRSRGRHKAPRLVDNEGFEQLTEDVVLAEELVHRRLLSVAKLPKLRAPCPARRSSPRSPLPPGLSDKSRCRR